jgi:hypothetical protein
MSKSRRRPTELNTDGGSEFKAEFLNVLRADTRIGEAKITHRVSEQQNDIATLDAAILKLRRALTRITSTPGRGNWAEELQEATDAYNSTPHGGILGEAPEQVSGKSEDARSLQFDLQQQNAEKYEQQSSVFKRKRERLSQAGAFRGQIKQRQGTGLARRGYKPTYEKEVVRLTDIDYGKVKGIAGAGAEAKEVTRNIREVMPVPIDSTAVRDPPGQGTIDSEEQLVDKVSAFLSMPRTAKIIRKHIGEQGMAIVRESHRELATFLARSGFRRVEGKWQKGGAASGSAGSVRQTRLK